MKTKNLFSILFIATAIFLTSCGGDSDGNGGNGGDDDGGPSGGITSISIEISSATDCGIYAGDTVTFAVTANTNQDLSNTATITVNGNEISGNSYTATESGSLQVVATYQSLSSSSLQVSVSEDTARFVKNVLIEDYTGTWCGYCPRVSHAIELTAAETDQIAVIAIHNDAEYNCAEVGQLEAAFGISGYPTAKVDRGADWIYPEPSNISQVVNKTLCDNAELGLAVSPTLDGSTMNIDVDVKFGDGFSFNNAKMVVMVLEDGLIADQENYTSYYGGVSVISNFEHNHVLRSSLTNVAGDAVTSGDLVNNEYTRTFSVNVPSNVANTDNMSIVAFITNENFNGDSYVMNARVGHFGEAQTFQEN